VAPPAHPHQRGRNPVLASWVDNLLRPTVCKRLAKEGAKYDAPKLSFCFEFLCSGSGHSPWRAC
jgi:hypothetical protein